MSRITDLLTSVRDTLNDQAEERWSNANLLRLINSGQRDIAKQANLFKGTSVIPLVKGQEIYQLPDDCIALRTVTYKGFKLPMVATKFMDNLGNAESGFGDYFNYNSQTYSRRISSAPVDWRNQSVSDGEILYAIYDFDKERELRVYPRPFNDDLQDAWVFDSSFGATDTVSDATMDDVFGVLNDVFDTAKASKNIDTFGVVADSADIVALTVHYTKAPPAVTSTSDELSISSIYDDTLQYWVTGKALRNDLDVQNRMFGAEELQLYQRDLEIVIARAMADNVTSQHHQSLYRGMG